MLTYLYLLLVLRSQSVHSNSIKLLDNNLTIYTSKKIASYDRLQGLPPAPFSFINSQVIAGALYDEHRWAVMYIIGYNTVLTDSDLLLAYTC